MSLSDALRAALLATAVACVAPALAGDARPSADEQCVAQCDVESDRCMASADTEAKAKVCDDQYTECLKKCR